ncbi:protein kinase, putative [Bodo saltans]|uniref:Protein kinase, putative n=1 Tax=Bodo saltans TaxID=75058 RepID=A0A0S4J6Q7_BODSA|nr:protein kinase, putative [Bodo saltans]|eukprot:CUG86886.1 protein kinase, putative [Bodo saltans]
MTIIHTSSRLIAVWLLLKVFVQVSCAIQCNTSAMWQNQNSCVMNVVDGSTDAATLRCVSQVCNIASALQTSSCTSSLDLVSLATTQSTCLSHLQQISPSTPQSLIVNATINASDSMLSVIEELLIGDIVGCNISSRTLGNMGACLSRLPCRATPSSLCSSLCLAQTLTCVQTYSCGEYFQLSDIGGCSPLLYVFDMAPLDALFCQAYANGSSWNQTAWILGATQLLALSNNAPSSPASNALTQYYVIVPGVLALVLLLIGTTVAIRKCIAMLCERRQKQRRIEVRRAETVENTSFPEEEWFEPPTTADSPPTAFDRTQRQPQQDKYKENPPPPQSSVPTAWSSKGKRSQTQNYHEDNGYDNESRELFRPRSQYVTAKAQEVGGVGQWEAVGDRDDMLFVEEDYEGYDSRRMTRASSTDDRTSAATTTGGDDRARITMPTYAGASRHRRPHSQTSLAELEFAFTDPSRTNGSNSQHIDDVIHLEPTMVDEDDGSSSERGQMLTPMSNSDTEEQRLVFDQESLRSSTNSQSRDDVIAAGSVMSRRDILHAILRGNFVRGRLLGRGTHGAVYQMNLTGPNLPGTVSVAMKEIDVQQCSREELSKIILRFNFLSRLSHRHIVEQYVVRYEPSTLSLNVWMEFLGGGTLTQLAKMHVTCPLPSSGTSPAGVDESLLEPPIATLKHRPHAPQLSSRSSLNNGGRSTTPSATHPPVPVIFPEQDIVRIVPQLLSALSYLHRKGVIHRDVKGSNVLMSTDHRSAKLADLDVCFITSLTTNSTNTTGQKTSEATPLEHLHTHSVAGSPLWMPPEILSSRCGPAPSTDMWSLGITIAEVLMGGALPWPRFDTTFNAMVYITHPGHPPVLSRADVSEACQEFLQRCWDPNADLRPSAMELRSHRWFQLSRPSSFRRVPSDTMGATKSVTNTNNSARSYESSLVWDAPGEAGAPTLEERQESLKKRFDESAMAR